MWSPAERWREERANYEQLKILSQTAVDPGPNCCRHNSTFLCTQSGKADWTMLGRNMVGFAPSFMGIWRAVSTRGMKLALTGVDFMSLNNSLKMTKLKLNFSQCHNMSEQPSNFSCITQRVASCFTFLHHSNHFSNDYPDGVTPMWA